VVAANKTAKPALTEALQDPDPDVRNAAAATLKHMKSTEEYLPTWDDR